MGYSRWLHPTGRLLPVVRSRCARRLDDIQRPTRGDPDRAIDHYALAGTQALADKPVIAVPVTHFDNPLLGLALGIDHPDEMALGTLQDCLLRHNNGVRSRCPFDPGPHELTGPQQRPSGWRRTARTRKVPCCLAKGWALENSPGRGRAPPVPSANYHFDDKVTARRKFETSGGNFVAVFQRFVFRED